MFFIKCDFSDRWRRQWSISGSAGITFGLFWDLASLWYAALNQSPQIFTKNKIYTILQRCDCIFNTITQILYGIEMTFLAVLAPALRCEWNIDPLMQSVVTIVCTLTLPYSVGFIFHYCSPAIGIIRVLTSADSIPNRTGGAHRRRRGLSTLRLAHGPHRPPNPNADRRGGGPRERVRLVRCAHLRLAARRALLRGRHDRRPVTSVRRTPDPLFRPPSLFVHLKAKTKTSKSERMTLTVIHLEIVPSSKQ